MKTLKHRSLGREYPGRSRYQPTPAPARRRVESAAACLPRPAVLLGLLLAALAGATAALAAPPRGSMSLGMGGGPGFGMSGGAMMTGALITPGSTLPSANGNRSMPFLQGTSAFGMPQAAQTGSSLRPLTPYGTSPNPYAEPSNSSGYGMAAGAGSSPNPPAGRSTSSGNGTGGYGSPGGNPSAPRAEQPQEPDKKGSRLTEESPQARDRLAPDLGVRVPPDLGLRVPPDLGLRLPARLPAR